MMEKEILQKILLAQKREITEYNVYLKLSKISPKEQSKILYEIAEQEKRHYEILRAISGQDVSYSKIKIFFYVLLAKILGLNFTLQLMERDEETAVDLYKSFAKKEASILQIIKDEREHERKLISLINEKRLIYISDFVLGLNDALVELTGVLAGLTLALNNTHLIAMVGLITGIAASLSMASSNYLAAREEKEKNALEAGFITGISYILTVLILIFPYFIFKESLMALIFTLIFSVIIVGVFNFYVAITKRENFFSRFSHMVIISLSVAAINFGIGFLIKKFFGIEV
jgi:VIT1/CCC1 family predicted Fe2+/Mn2+ transporter